MAKRKHRKSLVAAEPLPGGGSRHQTHSLRRAAAHLLVLRSSASHRFFAVVLMLLGLGLLLFFGFQLLRDPQLMGWVVTGSGGAFFLAGALVLLLTSQWEFDSHSQQARRRWFFGRKLIPFARLRAIQFVDGGWHGGRSAGDPAFRSFQLNLVLDDGERVNLTNHAEWHSTWEVGNELAEFLQIAVIDEVSEESDG